MNDHTLVLSEWCFKCRKKTSHNGNDYAILSIPLSMNAFFENDQLVIAVFQYSLFHGIRHPLARDIG